MDDFPDEVLRIIFDGVPFEQRWVALPRPASFVHTIGNQEACLIACWTAVIVWVWYRRLVVPRVCRRWAAVTAAPGPHWHTCSINSTLCRCDGIVQPAGDGKHGRIQSRQN